MRNVKRVELGAKLPAPVADGAPALVQRLAELSDDCKSLVRCDGAWLEGIRRVRLGRRRRALKRLPRWARSRSRCRSCASPPRVKPPIPSRTRTQRTPPTPSARSAERCAESSSPTRPSTPTRRRRTSADDSSSSSSSSSSTPDIDRDAYSLKFDILDLAIAPAKGTAIVTSPRPSPTAPSDERVSCVVRAPAESPTCWMDLPIAVGLDEGGIRKPVSMSDVVVEKVGTDANVGDAARSRNRQEWRADVRGAEKGATSRRRRKGRWRRRRGRSSTSSRSRAVIVYSSFDAYRERRGRPVSAAGKASFGKSPVALTNFRLASARFHVRDRALARSRFANHPLHLGRPGRQFWQIRQLYPAAESPEISMTPPRRCTGDEFDWPSRSIQKEPKPRLAIYPMRLPEQTRQPIRCSRSCTSKVINSTTVFGLPRPIRTRDWPNEIRIRARRAKEQLRASSRRGGAYSHPLQRNTPLNSNRESCPASLPPASSPSAPPPCAAPPPRSPPRCATTGSAEIARGDPCCFFGRVTARGTRKGGSRGSERRRGAATSVVSRRETPRTAALRVEPRVARRGADDSTSRSPRARASAQIGSRTEPSSRFSTGRTNR